MAQAQPASESQIMDIYDVLSEINGHVRMLHVLGYLLMGMEEMNVEHIRNDDAAEIGMLIGHLSDDISSAEKALEDVVEGLRKSIKEG